MTGRALSYCKRGKCTTTFVAAWAKPAMNATGNYTWLGFLGSPL